MNVDVEKTRRYYTRLSGDKLCNCSYCQNYYAQIKSAYPQVAKYLSSLGIDIEKPFETSPLEPENGNLEYCACQYIAFGSCSETYTHKIGDVAFRKAGSYPGTGIAEQHFVLEFSPVILKADFASQQK